MMATLQPLLPTTTTGGANATANHVINAQSALHQVNLGWFSVAWSGGTPAAPVNATVSDGTITLTFVIPVTGFNSALSGGPLGFLKGANVTISVPAGGVGISAIVKIGRAHV